MNPIKLWFSYEKNLKKLDKALKENMVQNKKTGVWRNKEMAKNEIEWFDATKVIPVPKTLKMYRYTTEAISDKGDLVCYDYKDNLWKKLVIEDEKVTYVPVEVEMWCNKPTKESE